MSLSMWLGFHWNIFQTIVDKFIQLPCLILLYLLQESLFLWLILHNISSHWFECLIIEKVSCDWNIFDCKLYFVIILLRRCIHGWAFCDYRSNAKYLQFDWCKYQWNVKCKIDRPDIQNIWIYTNLKQTNVCTG